MCVKPGGTGIGIASPYSRCSAAYVANGSRGIWLQYRRTRMAEGPAGVVAVARFPSDAGIDVSAWDMFGDLSAFFSVRHEAVAQPLGAADQQV